ncbi:unnamed protein product [Diatraea saccharalis]|uniref:Gag-like protein n=1 Tax=Diatraea saccharalis TaxID=40085 RepID=A0A9N9REC8_9NEOP|nr:unnamed protein product [Diatraea saccharalis]
MTKNRGKKASGKSKQQKKPTSEKRAENRQVSAPSNEETSELSNPPESVVPSTSSESNITKVTKDKIQMKVNACEIIATPSTSISFPGPSQTIDTPEDRRRIEVEILIDNVNNCQISSIPVLSAPAIVLHENIDPDVVSKWPRIRKSKVPCIFLHQPIDFTRHIENLVLLGVRFYFPKITKIYSKILCETIEDHKKLMRYFENNDLPHHTFCYPPKKFVKVVIRGLSDNVDLLNLRVALRASSIPVKRVHKMLVKDPQNSKTFILAVIPLKTEAMKLFKIKSIFGQEVTIEPPDAKPKQCHRCQRWDHNQRFCRGEIKCVKCAGNHWSIDCTLDPKTNPPKCANCGRRHTANFRRCSFCPQSRLYKLRKKIKETLRQITPPNRLYSEIVTIDNWRNIFNYVNYFRLETNVPPD